MANTTLLNHKAHKGHEGAQSFLGDLRDLCGSGISLIATAVLLAGAAGFAQTPAQQQPAATFRSTTRLIVQTVNGQRQGREAHRRSDGEGLHRHRGRRAQTVSFVEFQRLPTVSVTASGQITIGDADARSGAGRAACRARQSRRIDHRRPHRVVAARRHPVSEPAPADPLFRSDGDAAARSASRVQRGAQVHQDADDAGRSRRGHGFSGWRRPREAGLHRQQGTAARGGADARLRRRQGRRRHPGHARGRHRLRPGRCRVRHPEYRSAAVGAADGGRHAASAARPEVARLLRERPAAERRGQPGAVARDDKRRASARTSRSSPWTRAGWWRARRSATRPGARRPASAMFNGQAAGNLRERLPAVAGHALLAREGHRRQGDVRLQRPVDGHRPGGAVRHELLHPRLLQHPHGARRQVPSREDHAREQPLGRRCRTGRATSPTRSSRSSTKPTRSASSKTR